MSELISGKEALIALANGDEVQGNIGFEWVDISVDQKLSIRSFTTETNDLGCAVKFRLKPRTTTLNGIEVPVPAGDKDYHNQGIWILNSLEPKEYGYVVLDITDELPGYWWKSESEVKQVVEALRSVFKPQ